MYTSERSISLLFNQKMLYYVFWDEETLDNHSSGWWRGQNKIGRRKMKIREIFFFWWETEGFSYLFIEYYIMCVMFMYKYSVYTKLCTTLHNEYMDRYVADRRRCFFLPFWFLNNDLEITRKKESIIHTQKMGGVCDRRSVHIYLTSFESLNFEVEYINFWQSVYKYLISNQKECLIFRVNFVFCQWSFWMINSCAFV